MATLRGYIEGLRKITIVQQEEGILQILKANQATAMDLNLAQLLAGKDSTGKTIEPKYSESYAEFKKIINQPSDRVTLKLDGGFHESWYMDTTAWPAFFGSDDFKEDALVEKYGDNIFGLDEASMEDLNKNYLLEQIQVYYKKLLQLQ
jgi:hypothetical protein